MMCPSGLPSMSKMLKEVSCLSPVTSSGITKTSSMPSGTTRHGHRFFEGDCEALDSARGGGLVSNEGRGDADGQRCGAGSVDGTGLVGSRRLAAVRGASGAPYCVSKRAPPRLTVVPADGALELLPHLPRAPSWRPFLPKLKLKHTQTTASASVAVAMANDKRIT